MSARKIAESISRGLRENEHLGKHTPETLQQELFSLRNTKPMFRDSKWRKRFDSISENISRIKDERTRNGIKDRAQAMLSGEV